MTSNEPGELGADELDQLGAIEFNRRLLQNPSKILENAFLKLVALENPELPMLSPISRAAFYSQDKECRMWIEDCLRTTHVVCPDLDEETHPVCEVVQHKIVKRLGDLSFTLRFESTASLIWAGEEECDRSESRPVFTLLDVIDDLKCLPALDLDSFHLVLKKEAQQIKACREAESRSRPIGYITDDGAFVCSIEHVLLSVNDVAIKSKPEIWDSVHELYVSSVPEHFSAPDDRWSSFSWVSLLALDEAEALEIKPASIRAANTAETQPSWQLINASELDDSYQKGELITRNTITRETGSLNTFFLLLGAGDAWHPAEEADLGDGESYPCEAPPMVHILLEDHECMTEDELPYIECLKLVHEALVRSSR